MTSRVEYPSRGRFTAITIVVVVVASASAASAASVASVASVAAGLLKCSTRLINRKILFARYFLQLYVCTLDSTTRQQDILQKSKK